MQNDRIKAPWLLLEIHERKPISFHFETIAGSKKYKGLLKPCQDVVNLFSEYKNQKMLNIWNDITCNTAILISIEVQSTTISL
jgi:hypothetical protein